jgi:hypothetical protein
MLNVVHFEKEKQITTLGGSVEVRNVVYNNRGHSPELDQVDLTKKIADASQEIGG